jgi:DDE superfamily endonuclease
MPTRPTAMRAVLVASAPPLSRRVWGHAQVLPAGAILAPARRTVAAALRVVGLDQIARFHRSHRVLSRARWSSLAASRVPLRLLAAAFAPTGPLVFGVDETLERRRGKKIAPNGIDRDAVRSSHDHFAKASGLRWVCLMLLVPIPRAARTWALPVLTALAPSERYDRERGRRRKALTEWAGQLLLVVRRWWPDRPIVAVAGSTYAALEFLAGCRRAKPHPVTVVTRLRLDAALYEPAPPRRPHQTGRPRLKGKRLPTLAAVAADLATVWAGVRVAHRYGAGERTVEVVSGPAVWYHTGLPPVPLRWVLIRDPQGTSDTQALLCTDLGVAPAQILAWFVRRWQLEVTFEEVRRHLGVETQRQWSEGAIRRTTPALLGLFSLVTLLAHRQMTAPVDAVRQAAWYRKPHPTFADALALVRRELWRHQAFHTSACACEVVKLPRAVVDRLTETLCYAA